MLFTLLYGQNCLWCTARFFLSTNIYSFGKYNYFPSIGRKSVPMLNYSHNLISFTTVSKRLIGRVTGSYLMASTASIKRSQQDGTPNKRFCGTDQVNAGDSGGERVKKRKVALLMGYCGQGYLGMQRNIGFRTIEEELLIAMKNGNIINEDGFSQIQNIQFQRAARTDKGVSAVRQVVSLKIPETTTADDINAHLPEEIRVFAIKRVTKGFNSKSSCDARTYSYMLPTLAFSEPIETENYRMPPETRAKIDEALKYFTGTHNFHNFTARKKPQDPSAIRYILRFDCSEPFVHSDMEFVTIKVKGQSFMLHQIRKMIGTTIAIVRGLTSTETITKAWGELRFDLPIAPGLGLVLEEVHYDRYNTKFGRDGMHEALIWNDLEDNIKTFREKYIDSVIVATEKSENSMRAWIETLPYHTFDIRASHVHDNQENVKQDVDSNDSVEDIIDEEKMSSNSNTNLNTSPIQNKSN